MKDLLRRAPTGEVGLEELAALVAPAADAELAALMRNPATRKPILDLIYEASLERLGAEPLDLDDEVIHWHIDGASQGGCDSFQLMIEGGIPIPSRCLTRLPNLSFEIGAVELLRLVAGQESLRELIDQGADALGGHWPFAAQLEAVLPAEAQ